MKRKLLGILALLFALALLGSCAGHGLRLLLGNAGAAAPAAVTFREPDYVDYTVYRFYYASLTPAQRQAYCLVYNGMLAHSEKILLPNLTETALSEVLDAVRLENPQILCVGTEYTYYRQGAALYLIPTYTMTGAQSEAMARAVVQRGKEIVAAAGDLDAYEMELYLHDAVCALSVYEDGANAANAYGALISGKAVCAGYTAAAKLLFDLAGLPNAVISGMTKDGGEEAPHAWNAVAPDGEWYYTDVTWDDPIGGTGKCRDYFNVGEEELSRTHYGYVLPHGVSIAD